jgi:O-succinylbenzoate synthase
MPKVDLSDLLKVETSFYQLTPKKKLGSHASANPRKGALLRCTFSDSLVGYGDCFPWPELGDDPLEVQLNKLVEGTPTTLTQQTLEFARLDAAARSSNLSLLSSKIPLSNHFLLTHFEALQEDEIRSAWNRGFRSIKLKVGMDPEREAKHLRNLGPLLRSLQIKVRLDFNGSLTPSGLDHFLTILSPELEIVDFIEDPFPYEASFWILAQEKWKVRLALDRVSESDLLNLKKGTFSVLVIKPAIQDWKKMAEIAKALDVSIVITSYLDHPIGQSCAQWVALQLKETPSLKIETCGINSHLAYETNAFSTNLLTGPFFGRSVGSSLTDTGWGFDDLVASLNWSFLSDWHTSKSRIGGQL